MRKIVILFLCGLAAMAGAGCGRQDTTDSKAVAKTPTGPTDAEIPVTVVDNVEVVAVTADDTMHFNGNRFTVHTGQQVRVELLNKGVRPPTEMQHNFVLLKPDTEVMTFNLASAQAKESNYMPGSLSDKVLAFTAMAGPGQTVTTSFKAPDPGKYTFLCNFPGHYAAGMYGTMTVVP